MEKIQSDQKAIELINSLPLICFEVEVNKTKAVEKWSILENKDKNIDRKTFNQVLK